MKPCYHEQIIANQAVCTQKTKTGFTFSKANSKADGQLASLKRNLMKTIVKNGIFRKEELNFLFRSTLEFTRLDKAKVKAIIKELKEDLDLRKVAQERRQEVQICCCFEKDKK